MQKQGQPSWTAGFRSGKHGGSQHGHPAQNLLRPPASPGSSSQAAIVPLRSPPWIPVTGIIIQRVPRFQTNPERSQGNVTGSSRWLSISGDCRASLGRRGGSRGRDRRGRRSFSSSKPPAAFVPWLLLGTTTVCLDGGAPVTMETRPQRFRYEGAGSLVAIGDVSLTVYSPCGCLFVSQIKVCRL